MGCGCGRNRNPAIDIPADLKEQAKKMSGIKLDGDPSKVVFAPYWGEFGWEVLKHVRHVHSHQAAEKVVCCERGKECLYPSATSFYFVDNPIPDDNRQNDGASHHKPEYTTKRTDLLTQLRAQYKDHLLIDRPTYDCHWHTSDLVRPKLTAKAELPQIDVVLGVRNRVFSSERNYQDWGKIAEILRSYGLTVGLVGTKDTSFEFPADAKGWEHSDGPTAGAIDLLHNCRVYAGVDTGPSHLAALMQVPMVVLEPPTPHTPNLTGIMSRANKRYCKVISGYDSPETMLGSILLALRDAHKPSHWFSQNGEDKWMVEHLDYPPLHMSEGVFVEVGAADGMYNSNTYAFEKAGWTGLVIEPDPRRMDALKLNRNCAVEICAVGSDPSRTFYLNPHADYSGFDRGGTPTPVTVKRLDELLDAHHIEKIDLLSIDTEGSELDVWSTFDAEKYQPEIVMVEWNTQGLPDRRKEIRDALKGYEEVVDLGGNLIFRRK